MKKMRRLLCIICTLILVSSLCACGSEEKTKDGYAKKLYLYNWSEYMTQDVLDEFKKEYGIEVVQTTYETNDEMLAKLIAGNKGEFDIAVPSNYYVQAMEKNDLLEPLDKKKLSNLDNLDSAYMGLDYDKSNKYCVPYMGTLTVWVGNKKKLSDLGVEIHNYADIENSSLKNNIIITDDAQQTFESALAACGYDPLSKDLNEIKKAKDYMVKLNGNVKSYSITLDARDSMAKNEAALALMYSGEALQALDTNKDLELVMDKEKLALSLDNFVLLKGSKHKKEAELFINFCLRPDISAKLTDEYKFVCFNKAAVDKLDDDLKNNPACVLSDDIKSRMYCQNEIPNKVLSKEVDAMTEIKSSRG